MATGLRREPNIHDRNIASSAGIRPYKMDLSYATATAFLTDKKLKGYNSGSAEAGDWFYNSTDGSFMIYNGFTSVWDRHPNAGNRKFFRWVPTTTPTVNGPAGAAVSGTGQAINTWSAQGINFQVAPLGTQTILAPIIDTTTGYLDLGSQDQTAGDGICITPAFSGSSRQLSFTTGTSAAFYTKATFKIATVANCGPLYLGFKASQAPAALSTSRPNFNEMSGIGLIVDSASIKITTNLASGGLTVTDTTQTATNATAFTLEVYVSAAGVVTYKINGAAPTATAAFTHTAASVVSPFIIFAQGTAQTACLLQNWECGFQGGGE